MGGADVRILLDTHALLWWLFDDPRLPGPCRERIAEAGNEVLVSSASAWEISTKHRLGKLPEAGDVPTELVRCLRAARFSPFSVTTEHALAAGALPGPHLDSFDRMLIAQARIERTPVATADPVFRDYGVRVIW
jgi:PIN domain nuclease of toxin-antitoxin system